MRTFLILLLLADWVVAGDERIGVATHFDQAGAYQPYVMPIIQAAGFGYFRDDLNWSLFETSKQVYAESSYKQPWIDRAASIGLKFVACLSQPPKFYGHWDIQATANFAAWLAVAEAGKIAAIEVVNEPNNVAEFQGSNGQAYLVKLTTTVRASVRAAGSTIPVIGLDEQGKDVLNMLAMQQASNNEIDGVVYHPYDPGDFIPEHVYEPPYTDYEKWVAAVRAATKLPIWETERNISTGQNRGEYESAVWNARRLLMSYGLNVEHTFIYQFADSSPTQSVLGSGLQPRQTSYVVSRLLSVLNGLRSIGPKAVVTSWDTNFNSTDFKNYVFTGPNYSSPTIAALWFGNKTPGYFNQHAHSIVTVNFPQKHPHVVGSTGGMVLDLVSGSVTTIQGSQYTSNGITGIPISDNPKLVVLQ